MSKERAKGKVILVTSGKGGVGKTAISASIAEILARNNKVLVVDMDSGLGKMDIIMGLEDGIKCTLDDVMDGKTKIKDCVVKDHVNSNLYLLPAATDTDIIVYKDMNKLIKRLRYYFDYIVIDSPAGIEDGFKNSVLNPDQVLLVVNQDISSLKDAYKTMTILHMLEAYEISTIVNRYNKSKEDIADLDDIKRLLDYQPIIGVVRESEGVVASTNKGIIPTRGDSDVYIDIINIVENITSKSQKEWSIKPTKQTGKPEKKRGFISKIFGK